MIQYTYKYTQIFMADMLGSGLVMYDASMRHLCRIESDYMKPTDTFISIADHNFTYVGGIYSVTTYCDGKYSLSNTNNIASVIIFKLINVIYGECHAF